MPSRNSRDEEASVVSSDSNNSEGGGFGGGQYLSHLFGGGAKSAKQQHRSLEAIVPQYPNENRILMRSPLPSPKAPGGVAARKQIPHARAVGVGGQDSDSEAGSEARHKREEAHMSRLVHMAKAQQNLMTAWFAASAGEETSLKISQARRPRRDRRPSSSAVSVGSSLSSSGSSRTSSHSGPVDLDEFENEKSGDVKSIVSRASTGSSRIRMFLHNILGSTVSVGHADQPSVMTDDTPRVTNVTAGRNLAKKNHQRDMEAAIDEHSDASVGASVPVLVLGKYKFTKNRIILLALAFVFLVALISVVAFLVSGEKKSATSSALEQRSDDKPGVETSPFILRLPTISPSVSPSVTESNAPSYLYPSQSPSTSPSPSIPAPTAAPTTVPLPTTHPSRLPSSSPTRLPSSSPTMMSSSMPSVMASASPSTSPTSSPSGQPSLTHKPSASPSSSPTTPFSVTTFSPVGPVILGEQPGEEFGHATALSADGNVLAVGARYFTISNADGSREEKVGRVQVYRRSLSDGGWVSLGQVLHGRNEQDQFGFSVALSGDGTVLAVSEPGFDGPAGDRSGSARVFRWDGGAWAQLGSDVLGDQVASLFGVSISLSADGTRFSVGSPYYRAKGNLSLAGRVRVYELQQNEWTTLGQPLEGSSRLDWFGWSVDLSASGNRIAVGAPRNRNHGGYVQVFDMAEGTWTQTGGDIVNELLQVHAEDRFGLAVSLDGDRVAIGSPWKDFEGTFNSGIVAVYQLVNDKWVLLGSPLQGDSINGQMGTSLVLRGNYLTVGSPGANGGSGMVTFHKFDGTEWDTATNSLSGSLPNEEFGYNLSTDAQSVTIAAGGPGTTSGDTLSGLLRVFTR